MEVNEEKKVNAAESQESPITAGNTESKTTENSSKPESTTSKKSETAEGTKSEKSENAKAEKSAKPESTTAANTEDAGKAKSVEGSAVGSAAAGTKSTESKESTKSKDATGAAKGTEHADGESVSADGEVKDVEAAGGEAKPKKRWWSIICKILFYVLVGVATWGICKHCTGSKTDLKGKLVGESIGNADLRYRYGRYIYSPKTGKILVDSIQWLYCSYRDTIGILAKNDHRAYINLNTGKLITSLDYDMAWAIRSDRGVMVKDDSIYIFRRDGSRVNADPLPYCGDYELCYVHGKLIVNSDNGCKGILDTAANWAVRPLYDRIEWNYDHELYNLHREEQCIVLTEELDTVLIGKYKMVDIDWSEGIIVSEYNGMEHLYDYEGKMICEVIYRNIRELTYTSLEKDAHGHFIEEPTECFVYTSYNGKEGLMDKNYHPLTPPLFYSIKAQTKHAFFAAFGKYDESFGTLIDDKGRPLR